jgi:hypothetical protein
MFSRNLEFANKVSSRNLESTNKEEQQLVIFLEDYINVVTSINNTNARVATKKRNTSKKKISNTKSNTSIEMHLKETKVVKLGARRDNGTHQVKINLKQLQ